MIQQEINLNLIPSSEPVVVHCNQYDEGKSRIIAHLYNGSHPYTPGANATVKVQGTKPDNHAFQYWCDISGSTVTVDVNIQMTAVAGRTPTQLIVNETSGVTGSFAFYLDVQASTLPPDIDVSETDLPILTEEAQEAARRAVQAAGAAEDSADRAASWSSNPPYIGANFNWYVYNIVTEQFVDTGILARGTNGQDGERGSLWYRGSAVSGKSATPTTFPTGIADANAGDLYLNVTEGAVYHCVTGGDDTTATWAYDFTLTGGGGGSGTDNYNDLLNQPKINGVTLIGDNSSSDLGINSGIMLSSIMHIGGETQRTVHEALEALDGKDAGGSFIKVSTPDASLYGDTLTLTDGANTLTTAFDAQGKAEFNGVMFTGTLTLQTGNITRQLEVPYFGNYATVISLWSATIAITTDSPELYGETVTVKNSNSQTVGTATISNQGTASVTVSTTGTYTVHCSTLTPQSVTVTEQTTYFVSLHLWAATLDISTTSTSLYGKTITIMKGADLVGTTAFSSSGSATFRVHETGIYTLTCDGYSSGVTVSAETTYPVSILAGLDLASWISAGSTTEHPLNPSSYADFAALEADEKAIRQLMTVHDAVDYLAQATAGDSLMESVIGSDVCAKWINLRDYALDTLYANSDIASEMDTADKYFYGEWVENSGTWGAKGNVPIMTSDTAPYGNAISDQNYLGAYQAFDNSAITSAWTAAAGASSSYVGYKSTSPICVKKVKIDYGYVGSSVPGAVTAQLKGSNDGINFEPIGEAVTIPSQASGSVEIGANSSDYYLYHIVQFTGTLHTASVSSRRLHLQFYGRELTVKQASAPTDGREYVQIGSDYYTEDWGEKEFAQGSTRKTFYDHGVEPYTQVKTYTYGSGELAEKLSDRLHLYQPSQSQSIALVYIENEDVHTYTMFAKVGRRLQISGSADDFIRMSFMTALPTDSYIITDGAFVVIKPPLTDTKVSLSGENTYTTNPAIRINTYSSSSGGEIDIEEWWLE